MLAKSLSETSEVKDNNVSEKWPHPHVKLRVCSWEISHGQCQEVLQNVYLYSGNMTYMVGWLRLNRTGFLHRKCVAVLGDNTAL